MTKENQYTMIRNLLSFFQTILGYKQASSDGIDSDTIAFCKEDRSIHTHDTDFYCGLQKLGTAAYQSTDAFSAAGHTHEYLPLSGGTVNGDTTITGTLSNGDGISTDGGLRVGGSSSFVGTATFDSNAIMNATINSSLKTNTHIAVNKGRAIINSLASAGSYVMLAKMNSTNGFFTHGTFGTDYRLQYTAASVVSEGKNEITHTAYLLKEDGNTHFPGTVTAPAFSGKLNGNANTASKWQTSRTITIGNTGKSVDGSSNVAWSLSEIGAAPTNHTHEYLPLSGGTVNGDTTIAGTLSNGDGMSTDGGLRVGGSSSFVGTATFDSTATFKGNAVMNGMLTVKGINLTAGSKLSSDDDMLMLGSGSNAGYVVISDDMVGNTAPTNAGSNWCIELGGNAFFSSVSQSSDQRLKENIQDVSTEFSEKYWDTENGLIHEYDWKKSGKHATGMIAQELLNYIPEAVNYNVEADSYSVDYTSATCKIIGAMFKKIKELEETIHALEER